jgi:hypothetical protein
MVKQTPFSHCVLQPKQIYLNDETAVWLAEAFTMSYLLLNVLYSILGWHVFGFS